MLFNKITIEMFGFSRIYYLKIINFIEKVQGVYFNPIGEFFRI